MGFKVTLQVLQNNLTQAEAILRNARGLPGEAGALRLVKDLQSSIREAAEAEGVKVTLTEHPDPVLSPADIEEMAKNPPAPTAAPAAAANEAEIQAAIDKANRERSGETVEPTTAAPMTDEEAEAHARAFIEQVIDEHEADTAGKLSDALKNVSNAVKAVDKGAQAAQASEAAAAKSEKAAKKALQDVKAAIAKATKAAKK